VPSLRRPGPPAAARDVVANGERAIAWAQDWQGDPVVVSTLALYLPTPSGLHDRVPFELIASAVWARETLTVVLVGPDARRYAVGLDDPGEVPPTVRERVTASIALSEHVSLVRGRGARITARRAPGGSDLTWNVVFDAGLDPADPKLRERAELAIADLKSSTGL
jgi:hypothetical protein